MARRSLLSLLLIPSALSLPFIPSPLSMQQLAQPGIVPSVFNVDLPTRYWEPISPMFRLVAFCATRRPRIFTNWASVSERQLRRCVVEVLDRSNPGSRLSFDGRSARMSNGFLYVTVSFTPPNIKYEPMHLRILACFPRRRVIEQTLWCYGLMAIEGNVEHGFLSGVGTS